MPNTQLSRVRLTSQGYEVGTGIYYGVGQPVYHYIYDDGIDTLHGTCRAHSREEAKEIIREDLRRVYLDRQNIKPSPVFYR